MYFKKLVEGGTVQIQRNLCPCCDTVVTHGVKIIFHVFAIIVCFMSLKIFMLTVQN